MLLSNRPGKLELFIGNEKKLEPLYTKRTYILSKRMSTGQFCNNFFFQSIPLFSYGKNLHLNIIAVAHL